MPYETQRSITGEAMPSVELRSAPHAPETVLFGQCWRRPEPHQYERIETEHIENLPGVKVIRLYDASLGNVTSNKAASLFEAKRWCLNPFMFYISKLTETHVVVTSNIGTEQKTPVVVLPLSADGVRKRELPTIEQVDMQDLTTYAREDELMEYHVERFSSLGGDLRDVFNMRSAEATFNYMRLAAQQVLPEPESDN